MAVTQAEMHGWPRVKWDRGEFDGERRIMCYWADRAALLLELDSNPFWPAIYNDGAINAPVRLVQTYPFGQSTQDTASQYAQYEYCIVRAFYSTRGPKWDAINGLFIDEVLTAGYQSFTADPTLLRWESDNKPVRMSPIFHDCLNEYQVYFHQIANLPAWVLARPGLCNSNVFTTNLPGIAFGAETLKYMGCEIHTRMSLGKVQKFDLTAKFVHKWSEWNKFWRPDKSGGTWEKLVTKDGDDYVQHEPVYMDLI